MSQFKNNENKKFDIIISHRGCIDGRVSTWIAKKANPSAYTIDISPEQMIEINSYFPGKHILCCDVIPPNLGEIAAAAASVTIIDHHMNNLINRYNPLSDNIKNKINLFMSPDECACKLVWRYFDFLVNDKFPLLLDVVDDGDRYVWNNPNSRALSQTWFKTRYNVPDGFDKIMALSDSEISEDIIKGNEILTEWAKEVDSFVSKALCADMIAPDGSQICSCYLVPATKHRSDVAAKLLYNSKIKVCAFWTYDIEKDDWWIALRSHPTVDCSIIAQKFPLGGGHPQSAGFSIYKGGHIRDVFQNITKI
jgi:oligoribonuclease NrnB/cAMP/cGMP phosphodiesterase (DHH superfamily)